ncbi:MAG: hypothetical protein HYX32_08255 [Actinobacteria bacterium]|nr:hypothetical protein [Actinomycetota bacterium]
MPKLATRARSARTDALAVAAKRLLPNYTITSAIDQSDGRDWYVEVGLTTERGITARLSVGTFFPTQMNQTPAGQFVTGGNSTRTYARSSKDYQVTLYLDSPVNPPAPSGSAELANSKPGQPRWAESSAGLTADLASIGDDLDGIDTN